MNKLKGRKIDEEVFFGDFESDENEDTWTKIFKNYEDTWDNYEHFRTFLNENKVKLKVSESDVCFLYAAPHLKNKYVTSLKERVAVYEIDIVGYDKDFVRLYEKSYVYDDPNDPKEKIIESPTVTLKNRYLMYKKE